MSHRSITFSLVVGFLSVTCPALALDKDILAVSDDPIVKVVRNNLTAVQVALVRIDEKNDLAAPFICFEIGSVGGLDIANRSVLKLALDDHNARVKVANKATKPNPEVTKAIEVRGKTLKAYIPAIDAQPLIFKVAQDFCLKNTGTLEDVRREVKENLARVSQFGKAVAKAIVDE